MVESSRKSLYIAISIATCFALIMSAVTSPNMAFARPQEEQHEQISGTITAQTLTDEETAFTLDLYAKTDHGGEQLHLMAEGIIFPDVFVDADDTDVDFDVMLAGLAYDEADDDKVTSTQGKKATYVDSFFGYIIETSEGDRVLTGSAYTDGDGHTNTWIDFIATLDDDDKLTDIVGIVSSAVETGVESEIFIDEEICAIEDAGFGYQNYDGIVCDQTGYFDDLEDYEDYGTYTETWSSFRADSKTASTFSLTQAPVESSFTLAHEGDASLKKAVGDFAAGDYEVEVFIEGDYEISDGKVTITAEDLFGELSLFTPDEDEIVYDLVITKFTVSSDLKTITYSGNVFEDDTKVGSISSATLKFGSAIDFEGGLEDMLDSSSGSLKAKIGKATFDTKKTSEGTIESG